ncbi:hypothetical protein [Algihabitans albus]|uniref:hypothetical protein n=1 Tax=Algihabitans albus TaxID=2164067 RepID=UPI000E5D79EC|nr:hypothetical protein [Algihabitans albus]
MPRDGLFRRPDAPSDSVCDLAAGERLLLWSYRSWLEGLVAKQPKRHEQVWSGLSRELGTEPARRLLGALSRLIYRCVREAQGEIAYNPNCCRRVGPDEYRLLALIAAAGRQEAAVARDQARRLLRGGPGEDLLSPAAEIATVLSEAGYDLPRRPADERSEAILRAVEALPLLDRSRPN